MYLCTEFGIAMTEQQLLEQVPVLREPAGNVERICRMGRDVELIVVRGNVSQLSASFQTELYAFNLHVQGRMDSLINRQPHVAEAPGFSSIMPSQLLQITATSADMIEYSVACSPAFMEELHLNLSSKAHIWAYTRPVFPMTQEQLEVAMHYYNLLREILLLPEIPSPREIVRDLVRSMILYIHGLYIAAYMPNHKLTRAEETVGRFMVLVEQQSHAHHAIEWYANELCLSPKYMANLVKQTTGRSAGDCINTHLMKQAKWLLGSTSLSIVEISDQLGFQNQSHFGTFFKRHEGLSPVAFRKKKE